MFCSKRVTGLGFGGHMVCVITTQLCSCRQYGMNDCGAVPIKLYLQKDMPSQTWPMDPDLKSRFAVSHGSVCWWEVLLVLPVLHFIAGSDSQPVAQLGLEGLRWPRSHAWGLDAGCRTELSPTQSQSSSPGFLVQWLQHSRRAKAEAARPLEA